ncbi:MAG TPA: ECF-type sigma factor [Thermoanaerobaculia bacterium]|jgi:DNA-directed RNA polymerase specialized sigma24 family protein|nr:ECF-type sigma factor [Thermoanaerobaculia bacterium]
MVHETGWEACVLPFEDWLRKRVSRIMKRAGLRPEPEHVREIVQDVYCRLLEGGPLRLETLRKLHLPGTLTYLTRVARSTVFDQVRAARAARRGGRRLRIRLEHVADPSPTPEDILLLSECRLLVWRRFLSIGGSGGPGGPAPRNARILWLALVEGWGSRELGRAFALAPRSVDTLVHRLRRRCADGGLELRRRRRSV